MSIKIGLIVLFTLGLSFLFFAQKITKFIFYLSPENMFNTPLLRSLFIVWPIRVIGVMCLISGVIILKSNPMSEDLKSDSSVLLLLEKGVITQGKVDKVFYQLIAPVGWKVIYNFEAKDPETSQVKSFIGSSQGPKKYYNNLSQGDPITVIYDESRPKLNCEIKCFLNDPVFSRLYRKPENLHLLDRFRGKYEIESYTYREWYSQQQNWKK